VSRGLKTTIAILFVLVVFGLITLPSLRQAIQRISGNPRTEEQSRREVMQIPISTPTDVKVQAQVYWLSATSPGSLEATTIELPLSADPCRAIETTSDRVDCGGSHAESAHDASGCVIAGVLPPARWHSRRGFFGRPVGGDSVRNSE